MPGFTEQLDSLEISLFGAIPSETSNDDKRSLLALHLACRRNLSRFRWLEIGSHLGGSLQALIRDPDCVGIESIDLRPEQLPDERIATIAYPDNSTARMRALLSGLPDSDMAKLRTHEAHTGQLDPNAFERPDVCFIDAEHTDEACRRDAEFCRAVLRNEGVILFHDIGIVYRAVADFAESLAADNTVHRLAYLPDVMFAIELGGGHLLGDPAVASRQLAGGPGVLQLLCVNDQYRRVLKGRRARVLRRLGLLRVDDPTIDALPPSEVSTPTEGAER